MARRPVPAPPAARLAAASALTLDEVTEPWPGHPVDIDGVEIFVRSTPAIEQDAEPALLVHGLGGSTLNWTDFAGLLRRRLASDAIDLPGFGSSSPPRDNDYRLSSHARTVIAYLETSGRGPVHLMGNSMGGAVTVLVAAQRPDLVRTLTLISPAVPDVKVGRIHPLRNDPRMALLIFPILGSAAMKRMRLLPDEARARGTIKLCFFDDTRFPERRMQEAIQEAGRRRELPWTDAAMLRSLRGLVRSHSFGGRAGWAKIRSIRVPTLVLWGDHDRLVAPDLAPLVADAIADARLLVLPDIGHVAMMEDPRTSARAVLALVDDSRVAQNDERESV
jgi:pimeloyl-ACP methyl ester carboxylesterase